MTQLLTPPAEAVQEEESYGAQLAALEAQTTTQLEAEAVAAKADLDAAKAAAATATPPRADTPAPETSFDARAAFESLQASLAPLTQAVINLQNRGQQIPSSLQASIDAMGKEMEEIKLRDMTDEEKVDHYKAKAERAAQAPPKPEVDAQQNAQLQQQWSDHVQATNGEFFNGSLMPVMKELAATHGISADDAERDMLSAPVYPTKNEAGVITGYNWARFRTEMTSKWTALAASRSDRTEAGRGLGDPGKGGGGVPRAQALSIVDASIGDLMREAEAAGVL